MRMSMENLSTLIELDNMREYIELIEDAIIDKEIDANKYGQKTEKILSELKKDKSINKEQYKFYEIDLINDYVDEFDKSTNIFPQKLRATTFIHLCSIFETTVKEKLNLSGQYDKKLKGYDGSLVHKMHSYLKENKGFNIDESDWEFIECCNGIRNRFIHDNSSISRIELPEEMKLFIEANEEIISIDSSIEIHLKRRFNVKYLETIEDIFKSIEIVPFKGSWKHPDYDRQSAKSN